MVSVPPDTVTVLAPSVAPDATVTVPPDTVSAPLPRLAPLFSARVPPETVTALLPARAPLPPACPAPNANWMFLARKIERAPVRSYGKFIKTDTGKLTFEYRPWLFLATRTVNLPEGQYAVGRGLFYPEILLVTGEKTKALLTMPPRYKKHEDEIGRLYGIADVRDTGLLNGIRAIWRWFTRNLFGGESKEAAAMAT